MSRPSASPINTSVSGWVARLNTEFSKVLDAPLSICLATSLANLTSTHNPKLYIDCLAITSDTQTMYISNGTTWTRYFDQITYRADLSGAATFNDCLIVFNAVLADLRASTWMASS